MVASVLLCCSLCLSADSDSLALRRSLLDLPAAKWTEVFGTYVRMLGKATAKGKAKGKYSISKNEIPDTVAKAKELTVPQVMYIVKMKGKKPKDFEADIKREEDLKKQEEEKDIKEKKDFEDKRTAIVADYDKFKKRTTLSVRNLDVPENDFAIKNLAFSVHYLKEENTYMLKLMSRSDGWQFLRYHPFTLLLDGERIDMPHSKVDDFTVSFCYEQFLADTDKALLLKLANAKEAEGQIGRVEFKIPQAVRDKLKEFLIKAGELKAGPTK